MDVMFFKALNSFDSETVRDADRVWNASLTVSFDSETVRDAFHTRSATKLIIAQAEEEQTLGRP